MKLDQTKEYQAQWYNRHNWVRELSELEKGDSVWISDLHAYGTVSGTPTDLAAPRSYLFQSGGGIYTHNHQHLVFAPASKEREEMMYRERLPGGKTDSSVIEERDNSERQSQE
ncbi:hypothetical protein PR048_023182 [Dryococelus australis]|uniref:Uncharacterized protein n=1 Tax=Dryococelus australis TaxID=614101 RepID=A0ABQ9GTD6_9NEOP|nr:hypothetical protein PR048_023182 [Dryococelus australis]